MSAGSVNPCKGDEMANVFRLLVVLFLGLPGAGFAQDYQAGIYDGRSIPGWVYSAELTATAQLPTWIPISGGTEVDGANCNLGASPVNANRAEYEQYFRGVTRESFANEMRRAGTEVTAGHLTERIELKGYPAMRNTLTARVSQQVFNFVITSLAVEGQLVTVTCVVRDGGYLRRVHEFYSFAEGLSLLAPPPR